MAIRKPSGQKLLPGGTVEDGEKPENAASREVREEAGYDIDDIQPCQVAPVEVPYPPTPRSEKERLRAEKYSGTRTHFFIARLGDKIAERPQDPDFVAAGVVPWDVAREASPVNHPLTPTRRNIIDAFAHVFTKVANEEPGESFSPDFEPEHLADIVATRHLQADPDWLGWYEGYRQGMRSDDDRRQIQRWQAVKHRHGAVFARQPTPRRGEALSRWGIDPLTLIPAEHHEAYRASVDAYHAHRDLLTRHREEKANLLAKTAADPDDVRLKVSMSLSLVAVDDPRYAIVPRRGARAALDYLQKLGCETILLLDARAPAAIAPIWLDHHRLAFDHVVDVDRDGVKAAADFHVADAYGPQFDVRAIVHREMLRYAETLEAVG
jgi:8-oxo-dGTP pyrophosphatase MutT (NUDIX family)